MVSPYRSVTAWVISDVRFSVAAPSFRARSHADREFSSRTPLNCSGLDFAIKPFGYPLDLIRLVRLWDQAS
jgi:hypothetical protein